MSNGSSLDACLCLPLPRSLSLSVHFSTSHVSARACGGPCDLLWLGVMYFNALDNRSDASSRKNAADPLVSANARLKPASPVDSFNQSSRCLHRVACRCICHQGLGIRVQDLPLHDVISSAIAWCLRHGRERAEGLQLRSTVSVHLPVHGSQLASAVWPSRPALPCPCPGLTTDGRVELRFESASGTASLALPLQHTQPTVATARPVTPGGTRFSLPLLSRGGKIICRPRETRPWLHPRASPACR